jgi:hypothetical protein
VIKIVFFLATAMALPCGLIAQQPVRSTLLDLPSAPTPQPVEEVASLSSSMQNTPASATPQPAVTQATPAQEETPEERRAKADKEVHAEEHQRMLGVIPNFNVVLNGHAEPLTPGQKFDLFFHGSVDPFQFLAAGVDAGLEQWEHQYPGYHYGVLGYVKRYSASYADGFDGNFWGNAVLPSLLHQDPRYFRLGHGKILYRAWYAAISNFRARSDSGKWEPNYSNVLGNFIGGAISNVYYPSADRGMGLTLQRGLTVTLEGAYGSLAVEFYPDVVRYFKHRHQISVARKEAAAAAATSQQP